ncbi:MAG: tRNA epoxyqueuosine(34) reductase QueG [Pseudomonadota bacterium]
MSADTTALLADLRAEASALGFDALGIAPAVLPAATGAELDRFLDAGYHGEMGWMADTVERRRSPHILWPEARSVIALAMSYTPEVSPLETLERPLTGTLSVYARGDDYHEVIKPKLKQLARWLLARAGGDVKVFIDTAPLMEKPLAALAGLGWQGKHSNLLSRDLGNWTFLGFIATTLELPHSEPATDRCGSCNACLTACPTEAFPAPYQLDARRCISYLTIEHPGPIPRSLRLALGNRIYGCDDCLAVCPWNKFAQSAREQKLQAREAFLEPDLIALVQLDDAGFRSLFRKTAVKRIGRTRFIRNCLMALGNSSSLQAVEPVIALLDDPAPLLRGAAVWALGRLDGERFGQEYERRAACEGDARVRAEWRASLKDSLR